MNLVPPAEAARRARAAIAYAGLEDADIVKATGIKPGTLRNIVSKTRPSSGSLDNLVLIADACKVPREFMEGGWSALTAIHHGSNNLNERMQSLSEELHERMARLEQEVSEAVLRLGAGGVEREAGRRDRSSADSSGPGQEDQKPLEQQ